MPFCCPYDLDFSEMCGLKAYILPTFDPQSEDLWAVRMDYVPGDTGVLLKADRTGEYKIPLQAVDFHAYAKIAEFGSEPPLAPFEGCFLPLVKADLRNILTFSAEANPA